MIQEHHQNHKSITTPSEELSIPYEVRREMTSRQTNNSEQRTPIRRRTPNRQSFKIVEDKDYLEGINEILSSEGPSSPTERHRRYTQRDFCETIRRFWRFEIILGSAIVWSVASVLIIQALKRRAADGSDTAQDLVNWFDETSTAISIFGIFFSFVITFRTNLCYDRWWEGRELWGRLIYASIDLATQVRRFVKERSLADRANNFIIIFGYCCKAQLRDHSIGDSAEEAEALVSRGLMRQEEFEDLISHPGWQPYFVMDVIRECMAAAFVRDGVVFDTSDPARGGAMRAIDNSIAQLAISIGGAIRVRATGLPKGYDDIILLSYFAFVSFACLSWAVTMEWLVVPVITMISTVILSLMVFGTLMSDPFGTDFVDHPLDNYCKTIELQVRAIDQRSKRDIKSMSAMLQLDVKGKKKKGKRKERRAGDADSKKPQNSSVESRQSSARRFKKRDETEIEAPNMIDRTSTNPPTNYNSAPERPQTSANHSSAQSPIAERSQIDPSARTRRRRRRPPPTDEQPPQIDPWRLQGLIEVGDQSDSTASFSIH